MENLYQEWELIAGVHGVNLKIPFLEERRYKAAQKRKKKEKPVPLHLQMMQAGIQVKTK